MSPAPLNALCDALRRMILLDVRARVRGAVLRAPVELPTHLWYTTRAVPLDPRINPVNKGAQ
ncbi:MAG: hypothetical protein JSS43_10685 [Proteobacteria bacterium]|nr:hypothetical protein [Pseudomonadota bacterium]